MYRTSLSILLTLSLLGMGFAATASGEAEWVSLNGTSGPTKPTAVVLSSNESETVVRFTVHGFWSEQVIENGVTYQRLRFPDHAGTLEIGKPHMPVITELIGIPGSANVTVSVVDYTEVILPGYHAYPFQKPLLETEKRVAFDIDRSAYQQNAFYPDWTATTDDPGIWRDLRVVNLRVCPIAFNAATGDLRAYSEVTVKLQYSGTSNVNVKEPLRRRIAPNWDRMYHSSVLNYDYLDKGENIPTLDSDFEPYDYLIIAADAYVSTMIPLRDYKYSRGLVTSLTGTMLIGHLANQIKDYIKTEYERSGISYVLLVGDENDINGYEGWGFFSDYYYSLLEGDDHYPDIAIGRFCAGSQIQVFNMVSKSMVFEDSPPEGDWLEKSLLIAHEEEALTKYQKCKEEIRLATDTKCSTYSALYPAFTTCYGASEIVYGDNATNADVVSYFNEGFRLVNYRGHGDTLIWSEWNLLGEDFGVLEVDNINNVDSTPVVLGIACLTADIKSGASLAEAFTVGPDAAVAYLGASYPSYTDANHDYDKQFYAAVFDEGINAIGDASNEAAVRIINKHKELGIDNARMYLWLGDPSLQLIYQGPAGPICPDLSPSEIGPPTSTFPGSETLETLKIRNDNNHGLAYTYSIEEDNGPTGWLDVSGLSDTLVDGPDKCDVGLITLNKNGIINSPGNYYGRINFQFTYLGDPFMEGVCDSSIEVALYVGFGLMGPVWDIIKNPNKTLTASNHGNIGRDGIGTVNMDFYPEDCDSTATVYLYDGSPFVGRVSGDDTLFSWSIWGVDYLDDFGFRPQGDHTDTKYCGDLNAEVFESGTFTSQDSAIAIEKIWVAPSEDCEFILEYMRAWSHDGATQENLLLGEAVDWDVPWDHLPDDSERISVNTGGTDPVRSLLYQQGYEAYGMGSDTGYPYNCQYNDERFGGNAFVESYLNGSFRTNYPYGGFVGERDSLYHWNGFRATPLYEEAMASGLRGTDSTEDLLTVMTFEPSLDLGATDVYEVVTVLATVQQGTLTDLLVAIDEGRVWYLAHGGMTMFADNNSDGQIDVCEGCCKISGDFDHNDSLDPLDVVAFVDWLWRGGPEAPCPEEPDANGDEEVNPLDVLYLVDYFWKGGPAPVDCP